MVGFGEGTSDGVLEGAVDRIGEGTSDGVLEGAVDGIGEGTSVGIIKCCQSHINISGI